MEPIVMLQMCVCFFTTLLCAAIALRRAMHIYQLCSYQKLSYTNFLSRANREVAGPGRLFPLIFLFFGAMIPKLWFLSLIAAVLFVLCNRYPAVKKPLVYTPRVKRMLATATVFCLLVLLLEGWLMTSGLYHINRLSAGINLGWVDDIILYTGALLISVIPCALIVLQPWLVMLYNAINAPYEKAKSDKFINEARAILRGMPNLTIIGITGSYGKTSTKFFLQELLSLKYNVYMTPGNFNTTLGVVRAVREGLRPVHDIFLCEMGARHVGDIREICDLVHPHMGVITYIGQQHLETFGSQEALTGTKLELADALQEHGKLFVNFDSDIAANQTYLGQMTAYGSGEGCAYRCSDVYIDQSGARFTVTAPDGSSQNFETRLLGSANVQNLTGAIAVAHSMGIPFPQLAGAVSGLKSVPHRLQLLPGSGMTIIDDAYNSNPQGAAVALETLGMCRGTRIVVTPGLVELGKGEEEANRKVGEQAAAVCDYIVTVGGSRARAIRKGAFDAGFSHEKIYSAKDLNEAMAHVRSLKVPDKMVLLLNDLTDNYESAR